MEQLLCHLVGDYIFQSNWMANNKKTCLYAALLHGMFYTLAFLFITTSIPALIVIAGTHILIDYFGMARYIIFFKNWLNEPGLKWIDCDRTGYPNEMPAFISVWLLIITDNCIHLLINFFALRYL